MPNLSAMVKQLRKERDRVEKQLSGLNAEMQCAINCITTMRAEFAGCVTARLFVILSPDCATTHPEEITQMNHIMMKTILFTALVSAVPYGFAIGPIPHTGNNNGERFAPVTLAFGQSIRAVIANVRIPDPGDSTDPCAVMVSFLGADGSLIGGVQTVQLAPGASESVPADSAAGLVRVIVSLQNSDSKKLCAVKGNVEVFDSHTGGTLFLLTGQNCLGAEPCSTPLRP